MSHRPEVRDTASFAARTRALGIVSAVAVVVALIQRSGLTPFPHRADDFLGGFAVGVALVALVAFLWTRDGHGS